MKKLSILSCGLIVLTACANPNPPTNTQNIDTTNNITTPVAQKAEGIWIDVRSVAEYQQGHLENALNITNEHIGEKIPTIAPNKDTPIHLYCRSGSRAEVVKTTLTNMGYTNVTNHGGYDDLIKQGLK